MSKSLSKKYFLVFLVLLVPALLNVRQGNSPKAAEKMESEVSVSPEAAPTGAEPAFKKSMVQALACAGWTGPITDFPTCAVLPIEVASSMVLNKMEKIDETNSLFVADFDLRLEWHDPRITFMSEYNSVLRRDWTADLAQKQLEKMWVPPIVFANKNSDVVESDGALSVYGDGKVVWKRRLRGEFQVSLDLSEFPFDEQVLEIQMTVPTLPERSLLFTHKDADRKLTVVRPGVDTPAWTFSHIRMEASNRRMINGDKTSILSTKLKAERLPMPYVPPIFLPLIVTIFLPILALWVIDTDVHERINWTVTGVFALIALNFTVSVQYPMLGPDSTVMQFFWIGYGLQCLVFMEILLLYNESVTNKLMDIWMRDSLLGWLRWALPVVTVAVMAYCMLLAAS